MLAPGIRVVRGPDWIWQNQDGGEGHVGTVCEIGRYGSTHSPEKTVVVNWDSGHRTNYRVGYQGQFDLIVVDNAQVGVKHPNVICDGCSKAAIAGIRFRCAHCKEFDICATCYGNDVHDLDHPFIRYQTSNSVGVHVPARQESVKIQLKGIFISAKVVRGPDWEWGNQDGGEGKIGRVMEIRGWDNESCRSVANVSWSSGSINVYRLGHKGNVDLKYVTAAIGGCYYKNHMPVLGQSEEQQPVIHALRPVFSVGDRVKVCLDKNSLMKLQQGHGGWNPRMADYLGKIGTVHRITEKGDIRVQYEGCANRWTFHPAALAKVSSYHVGDLVTLITDLAKVQQYQKNHGEWVETMRNSLGKVAKIVKIYGDGDLRIQEIEDGFSWTVNPKCVKLERPALQTVAERSNSMMDLSHQRPDHVMTPLSGISGSSAADNFVREAAQGKLEYVQQYLERYPDQVDVMSGGKTALQVAAHQGVLPLVRYLIAQGANVNIVDKEGDSTLHYAAFGNQPEVMRILLQNGANIDILNAGHCSALHISAHKKPPHCVKILFEFGADVNVQDSYGDTPLHDAIGKENHDVVDLLCSAANLDLSMRNVRGFNALHHAALKGNVTAIKRLLHRARQLVDVKKDDGFAALHLAALNGHAKVVEALVKEGKAEIDIRNNRRQTPFLLAVSQGHAAAIEKLVELKCDITTCDEDGDNAMHLCVIKKVNLIQEVMPEEAPKISEIYQSLNHITENRLMATLLCFLAQEGCKMEANNKGARIFDWVTDLHLRDLITTYQNKYKMIPQQPAVAPASGASTDDQIYSNLEAMNIGNNQNNNIYSVNSLSNTEQNQSFESDNTAPTQQSSLGSSGTSSSNPPTPARRNKNNQITRDAASSPLHAEDASKQLNTEVRGHSTMSPLTLPPGSSSGMMTTPGASNNDNEFEFSGATTMNTPATGIRHISRRQPQLPDSNLSSIPPQPTPKSSAHSNHPQECIVCNENTVLIIFGPCCHQISCEECGMRMKKCLACGVPIDRRFRVDGLQMQLSGKDNKEKEQPRHMSADRVKYLERKIVEIEETHCCSICMERKRNVAFLCGHGACSKCSEPLKICHMCRKTIVKKINLY